MARHNDLGKKGELAARRWLEGSGYEILEVNWRFKKAEVDIFARLDDVLIVVEVKTRKSDRFGDPEAFIGKHKEFLLIDAAVTYAETVGHDGEIRFDVIGIILRNGEVERIHHIEDAFFPEIE